MQRQKVRPRLCPEPRPWDASPAKGVQWAFVAGRSVSRESWGTVGPRHAGSRPGPSLFWRDGCQAGHSRHPPLPWRVSSRGARERPLRRGLGVPLVGGSGRRRPERCDSGTTEPENRMAARRQLETQSSPCRPHPLSGAGTQDLLSEVGAICPGRGRAFRPPSVSGNRASPQMVRRKSPEKPRRVHGAGRGRKKLTCVGGASASVSLLQKGGIVSILMHGEGSGARKSMGHNQPRPLGCREETRRPDLCRREEVAWASAQRV